MSYQDAISQAAPFEVLDGTFPTANPDSPLAARLAECEKQGLLSAPDWLERDADWLPAGGLPDPG